MIELIIAIVIISILATVALPRFVRLEDRAEEAVLLSALGALRSSARITEGAVVSQSGADNGLANIENKTVLIVNRFPAARDNNITDSGPGAFQGILALMELDGSLAAHYSNSAATLNAESSRNVRLILALNDRCVFYQPPSVLGNLPSYSDGVLTFNSATNTCS